MWHTHDLSVLTHMPGHFCHFTQHLMGNKGRPRENCRETGRDSQVVKMMNVFKKSEQGPGLLSKKVKSLSRVWLCDPVDCSPPGSSVHGILQEGILEWVAISFSRGSSQPRDRTRVSCIAGRCFILWATRKAPGLLSSNVNFPGYASPWSPRFWSWWYVLNCSFMSNTLWSHGLEPTRLLCPWNSLGKNTVEWAAISSSKESSQPRELNPCALHWQVDSLPLSHLGSPWWWVLTNTDQSLALQTQGEINRRCSVPGSWSSVCFRSSVDLITGPFLFQTAHLGMYASFLWSGAGTVVMVIFSCGMHEHSYGNII